MDFETVTREFLSGSIAAEKFLLEFCVKDAYADFLQSSIPYTRNDKAYYNLRAGDYLYADYNSVKKILRLCQDRSNFLNQAFAQYCLYDFIYNIKIIHDKNISYDSRYKDTYLLYEKAIPLYVRGRAPLTYIGEKIIPLVPKTGGRKALSDLIKEAFPYEKTAPKWKMQSKWLILNGRPLKFLYQTTDRRNHSTKYYFFDENTQQTSFVEI